MGAGLWELLQELVRLWWISALVCVGTNRPTSVQSPATFLYSPPHMIHRQPTTGTQSTAPRPPCRYPHSDSPQPSHRPPFSMLLPSLLPSQRPFTPGDLSLILLSRPAGSCGVGEYSTHCSCHATPGAPMQETRQTCLSYSGCLVLAPSP